VRLSNLRQRRGNQFGQLCKGVQHRLDPKDLPHAFDARDVTRHFHAARGLETNAYLALGETRYASRKIHNPRARATSNIYRRRGSVQCTRTDKRIHNLANPDEVDDLFAAIDEQVLSSIGLI
jgi:hypothetical protein